MDTCLSIFNIKSKNQKSENEQNLLYKFSGKRFQNDGEITSFGISNNEICSTVSLTVQLIDFS
jgi:hypothetical protein